MPSFLKVPASAPVRRAPRPQPPAPTSLGQGCRLVAPATHPTSPLQLRSPAALRAGGCRRSLPLGLLHLATPVGFSASSKKNAEIAWQNPQFSPSAAVQHLSPYLGGLGGLPGKGAVAWPACRETHAGFVCAGAPSPSSPQMVRSHDCTVKIELV